MSPASGSVNGIGPFRRYGARRPRALRAVRTAVPAPCRRSLLALELLRELARLPLDASELLREVLVVLPPRDPGRGHELLLHLLDAPPPALREPDRARHRILAARIGEHPLRRPRDEPRARLEEPPASPLPVYIARHACLLRKLRRNDPERRVHDVPVTGPAHERLEIPLDAHLAEERRLDRVLPGEEPAPHAVRRADHVGGLELEEVVLVREDPPARDLPAVLRAVDGDRARERGRLRLDDERCVASEPGERLREVRLRVQRRRHRVEPLARGE